ncbi:hypothetical protein EZV77_32390 [Burkholderia thailandensis]|nr:hypothetical protein EZV77_32390 [Burkholderia thailandensis]
MEWSFVGKPCAARRRRAERLLRAGNVGGRATAVCLPGDTSSPSRHAARGGRCSRCARCARCARCGRTAKGGRTAGGRGRRGARRRAFDTASLDFSSTAIPPRPSGFHTRAGRRKYSRMRNESADVCRFSITRRLMTH